MFKSNLFYCPSKLKKNRYFLYEGQIMNKTEGNIKRTRESILQLNLLYPNEGFMLFLCHCHCEWLQCWASGVDSAPLSARCSKVSVGRINIHKKQFMSLTYLRILCKKCARVATVCVPVLRKHTETHPRGSHGCKCFHIQTVCRWCSV